jgi:hypothetical protein
LISSLVYAAALPSTPPTFSGGSNVTISNLKVNYRRQPIAGFDLLILDLF